MNNQKRKGQGYIEIMVVVAVLLIITLLAIPRYQDLRRDAYRAQIANDSRLVEAFVIEEYFNTRQMPNNSLKITDIKLKEIIENKKSYYQAERISDYESLSIGGEKYLISKEEVLRNINTKLKGDFIYTDKGVIYVDAQLKDTSPESSESNSEEHDENNSINDYAEKKGIELKKLAYDSEYVYEPYRSRIDSVVDDYYESIEYAYSTSSVDSYYERAISKIDNIIQVDNRRKADPMERLFKIDNDFVRSGIQEEVNQLFQEAREKADKVYDQEYNFGREPSSSFNNEINKIIEEYLIKVRKVRNSQKPFAINDISIYGSEGLAKTADGKLYVWGKQSAYGIGRFQRENTVEPSEQIFFTDENLKIAKINRGPNMSAVITEDGNLYTWGNNTRTPLGRDVEGYINDDGSKGFDINYPGQVKYGYSGEKLPKFKDVKIGSMGAIALSVNGEVYVWGKNDNMPIGTNKTGLIDKPYKLEFDDKIDKIYIANHTFAAIDQNGNLYAWGGNADMRINGNTSLSIPNPTKVNAYEKVVDIDMSSTHMLILVESGNVYGMGNNADNSMGLDYNSRSAPSKINGISNAISVHAANKASLIRCSDGIYVLGSNQFGLFGDGSSNTNKKSSPYKVSALSNIAIKDIVVSDTVAIILGEDSTIYVWGTGSNWFESSKLFETQTNNFFKQ